MITHPDKVMFPDDGITKGDLAAYYEAVAPVMLPHIKGRPITMERYPAGIGRKDKSSLLVVEIHIVQYFIGFVICFDYSFTL